MQLVVIQPFGLYARGALITDPVVIASILGSDQSIYVIQVSQGNAMNNLNLVTPNSIVAVGPDMPLTSQVDTTTTAGVTYVGYALPGSPQTDPVWQIKAISSLGAVTWANGSGLFNSVWADRATLSYS